MLRVGSELEVQLMVCDYLRLRFPSALWRSDYASGLHLSIAQAAMHKRLQSSRAFPDLFIYEPSTYYSDEGSVEMYHGLAIELKRPGTKLYKKDGSLISDLHVQEQAAMLQRLRDRGYKAEFACGFDAARLIIDSYLEDETQPLFEF